MNLIVLSSAIKEGISFAVEANVKDCDIVVSEFKLKLCCYIDF